MFGEADRYGYFSVKKLADGDRYFESLLNLALEIPAAVEAVVVEISFTKHSIAFQKSNNLKACTHCTRDTTP